jgi:RNA polymerase sigma-70 factor, ECF subfamily
MSDTDSLDDRECIVRYLSGDVEAMDAMVERYRRPLFGFVRSMSGSGADADEIFQETWFRALRSLSRYRSRNFRAWLFRIARNLLIDRQRKRKPDLSIDAENADGVALGSVLPGSDAGPDEVAAALETGRRVGSAVARLPVEQREVFVMRVQSGLTFREIAVIQKVSINTVLARMQYALRKLREELREDYGLMAGCGRGDVQP